MSESNLEQAKTRTMSDYFSLVARGFAMGAADVVPGVSGGTMAFILGIYEELLNSIKRFASIDTIKMLLGFKLKEAFDVLPWRFLAAVAFGIVLAIATLARFLEWTLENHPVLLWSFFFGLVVASIITVSKRVTAWNTNAIIGVIIGTIVGYLVVGLVPVETPNDLWFLFLSGAIAICAMILPGISGSFLLVLMGKYEYILSAVSSLDIVTIAAVGAGAALGLVSFAQVLSWLFKKYPNVTIALLIGLMIGSLRKIWPWKVDVQTYIDRHGEVVPLVQENVLPAAFDSTVMFAIVLAIVGFVIVFALDTWASRQEVA